jgi:arylsulfatase A-like enzyme
MASSSCAARSKAATNRRNVILVSFDTMRADFLGAYGDTTVRTPVFDRFAATGVRFERAYGTVPFTPISLWGLVASQRVWAPTYESKLVRNSEGASLAARFSAANYRTFGLVGSSHLKRGTGFEHGFDTFLDPYSESSENNETTLSRALELLGGEISRRRAGGQPVFLWIHFFDPHSPWDGGPWRFRTYKPESTRFSRILEQRRVFRGNAPFPNFTLAETANGAAVYAGRPLAELLSSGHLEELLLPAYRGEITWSDDVFGRLLTALGNEGMLEDSVIAVTSDHGNAFAEHYQITGYGFSLFDESARVPLILHAPGLAPAIVKRPVSLIDVGATLLDLAGVTDRLAEGRSFKDGLSGAPGPTHPVLMQALGMPGEKLDELFYGDDRTRYGVGAAAAHQALILGTKKLIFMPTRTGAKYELFDLDADAAEAHDLFDAKDPAHQAMVELLAKMTSERTAAPGASLDVETAERLRALGYLR